MAEKNKTEEIIKNFFDSLGISGTLTVSEDEEAITVNLETEDSGMVIGYHGETLESLQLVTSLMLSKERGVYKRVSIEVGDYKKNRSEWLERLAYDAKERALEQQREVYLTDLKSWERRVIHLLLQDDKEVVSESSGEGKDRVLVIKPR